MSERFSKFIRIAAIIAVLSLATATAWAAKAVNVTASLTTTCPNCRTDADGANPEGSGARPYSLVSDGDSYSPFTDSRIQSQILTNNSVYTLDTSATLVDGLVVTGITRTVDMHFYSSVECKPGETGCEFPNNILPVCWGGNYDQDQAVNWSVFSPISLVTMKTGDAKLGMARLNFNVRKAACDRELNRFRLEWGAVCITHPTLTSWVVTSGTCVTTDLNYGEAHLQAYGGRKQNTVDYGDWRMPFVLTLTKP
jgi:hypothetical protein